MPKRIIAAIIGALAVVSGIVACGYAFEVAVATLEAPRIFLARRTWALY